MADSRSAVALCKKRKKVNFMKEIPNDKLSWMRGASQSEGCGAVAVKSANRLHSRRQWTTGGFLYPEMLDTRRYVDNLGLRNGQGSGGHITACHGWEALTLYNNELQARLLFDPITEIISGVRSLYRASPVLANYSLLDNCNIAALM